MARTAILFLFGHVVLVLQPMKWFRAGIFYLAIMGVSHLVGHIAIFYSRMFHVPTNTDTLIIGGAALTHIQLIKGFSLWYSLFFLWLFGLSLALYSQRRIIPLQLFRQVSFIHTAMLALGTIISACFFFWFPAVCAALGTFLFCCSGFWLRRQERPV